MHTPESTLERGQGPPPYSAPVSADSADHEKVIIPHILSLPNPDECDNLSESLVCLQDIRNLANDSAVVNIPPVGQDSSPDTPQPAYDLKQGWMNGIFGCLRPVLSIIGKGVVENKNVPDDWEIPFEKITQLTFLGCGAQGAVFSGMLNDLPVAVKKVNELKDTDIRNLRKLNHPNIVKFQGVCTQEPCFCIVMEFCPYGTLFNLLKTQAQAVTIQRVVNWSKQIASGMNYLHMHKIIHRDLKSPNVLIGEDEVIKISDFGTCRTFNGISEKMTFAGTVAWMAPEAIQEKACSEKVDIWSFGVVLWELLTCEVPYEGLEQSAIMYSVGSGKLTPPIPESCPDGFKLIMQICWKMNPKERPSFKLICNHLEIASVEILAKFEDKPFFITQENWKQEIKTQITQFVEQFQKTQIEYKLKEEQLIEKRQMEIKHIKDIRELYDRKLEKVNQLYMELNAALQYIDKFRHAGRKKRVFPVLKKNERRRSSNQSTTPTSPDCSLTSPDTPQLTPAKLPLYATLNDTTDSVSQTTQTSISTRKRHYRTNSSSPRGSGCSRISRTSTVTDAETQTDSMDVSEPDLSPSTSFSSQVTMYPQRVILQEFRNSEDDDERVNGNSVQLHYMAQHSQPSVQVFTRVDSRSTSPILFNQDDDTINRNMDHPRLSSDEENLETLGRKVSEMRISTLFSSENGNLTDDLGEIIRKKASCDTRDSTEDAANDSFTDEEGEICNHSLRRRSVARRPIYPGRRPNRYKFNHHYQREQQNASDEGNTSEYSVSPSSKSSTLESNPERIRLPNISLKRPNLSDGSSESESEENMTIVTQLSFRNKTENAV
ncbi:mitogen-activated protein kinase kinase kinase 13 isoform X3 [Aethina tumida]|uniref:mitogen-activated protein kinase kinase kinase 13 isoform X3 n=1 Tax=Aethina tumida TaxID=116153 RepID=UPI0021492A89|nr:mitogen-activated protein kinase kinase kinase 13 isoform X3 [Aethina tumida]